MATTELYVPSGEGKVWAPVGSEEWAKNMRLRMTGMVKGLNDEPERFARYVALFTEHRGWTLITDKRGKRFATWEAFCQEPQPHGLGKPAAEVQPFVVAAVGERAAGLLMADSHQGARLDLADNATSYPGDTKSSEGPADITRKRNLAILRAPSEVQRLYCDDLVSQKLAASLGPVKQTPERAAKIREAVNEAVAIVEATNPLDPEARRATKKKVDAKVREVLGTKAPSTSFATILDKAGAMSSDTRAALVAELIATLDSVHLHRIREALEARGES